MLSFHSGRIERAPRWMILSPGGQLVLCFPARCAAAARKAYMLSPPAPPTPHLVSPQLHGPFVRLGQPVTSFPACVAKVGRPSRFPGTRLGTGDRRDDGNARTRTTPAPGLPGSTEQAQHTDLVVSTARTHLLHDDRPRAIQRRGRSSASRPIATERNAPGQLGGAPPAAAMNRFPPPAATLDFAGKGLVDVRFDDLLADGEHKESRICGSATLVHKVEAWPLLPHIGPDGDEVRVRVPCRVRFRVATTLNGDGGCRVVAAPT